MNVAPDGCESWSVAAAPLLAFLAEAPRTWTEMLAWSKAHGRSSDHVRQCIAWAENRRLVRCSRSDTPRQDTWHVI